MFFHMNLLVKSPCSQNPHVRNPQVLRITTKWPYPCGPKSPAQNPCRPKSLSEKSLWMQNPLTQYPHGCKLSTLKIPAHSPKGILKIWGLWMLGFWVLGDFGQGDFENLGILCVGIFSQRVSVQGDCMVGILYQQYFFQGDFEMEPELQPLTNLNSN